MMIDPASPIAAAAMRAHEAAIALGATQEQAMAAALNAALAEFQRQQGGKLSALAGFATSIVNIGGKA